MLNGDKVTPNSRLSSEDIISLKNLYCPMYNLYNYCDGYDPLTTYEEIHKIRFPVSFRCNGISDCFDGSDEQNCGCSEKYCPGASQLSGLK